MLRHRHAYYEACANMLKYSQHRAKFEKVFDLAELTRAPDEAELAHMENEEPAAKD